MSVIYILWLRQMKRYLRARTRIVASLAQPLLFLMALGFGLGPTFEKAGNGSYIQFLAPGIVAMAILFSGMFSGIEILFDRQFGFLKETLVAPVPRLQIVLYVLDRRIFHSGRHGFWIHHPGHAGFSAPHEFCFLAAFFLFRRAFSPPRTSACSTDSDAS